jgi:hypothetical protein
MWRLRARLATTGRGRALALFFDGPWFAARLAELGLERADLALAAGLSDADLAMIWKDQREVTPSNVDCFAALLGEVPSTIARRCGVSTRTADEAGTAAGPVAAWRVAELENRVLVLEQTVALLLDRLDRAGR